jgi:hypothetical protein
MLSDTNVEAAGRYVYKLIDQIRLRVRVGVFQYLNKHLFLRLMRSNIMDLILITRATIVGALARLWCTGYACWAVAAPQDCQSMQMYESAFKLVYICRHCAWRTSKSRF